MTGYELIIQIYVVGERHAALYPPHCTEFLQRKIYILFYQITFIENQSGVQLICTLI